MRAAMLLDMRGEDARRILAKRSQSGACLLDPCGTDLRLQATIARSGPIVLGLLFTMNGATRTCDTGIWRSSETVAPRARGTRTYFTTCSAPCRCRRRWRSAEANSPSNFPMSAPNSRAWRSEAREHCVKEELVPGPRIVLVVP